MRQKLANEATVQKYISFLQHIADEHRTSLKAIIQSFKINKSVKNAVINLAIIDYKRDNDWHYLSFEPDRKLALTVLEYLLEKGKKQRPVPIAGMEDLVTAIKHNTEALARFSGLNRLKTSDTVKEVELFTIDSQRLQVACAIAAGCYADPEVLDSEKVNQFIVKATDHLISLLLNKA